VNVTPVTDIYGYSYPFIYNKNGALELLVGSEQGHIYRYGNITGNLNGTFTLLDSIYGNINEPIKTTVSGTDINGDGMMDLAVGNFAGGLTIYTQTPTGVPENNLAKEFFDVFPNPNSGSFTITIKNSKTVDAKISLQNLVGQQVFEKNLKSGNGINSFKIDLNNLDDGMYLLQLAIEDKTYTKKIVIQK
jgi:hypothetical protein